jgi:hypothetical protein
MFPGGIFMMTLAKDPRNQFFSNHFDNIQIEAFLKNPFRFFLLSAVLLSPLGFNASFASTETQSSTTTLTLDGVNKSKDGINKTQDPAKDIDNEITDATLRAQLGSKSKWSFKSAFTYAGSSVSDPFNGVRPNYRSSATLEEMTSLKGTIGINYRVNEHDNLSAGTGVLMIDPLHGDPTQPASDTRANRSGELERLEVATPYVSWNRGYRAGDYQLISGFMYAYPTSNDAKLFQTSDVLYLSQILQRQFGTRWSISLNIMLLKFIYGGPVEDPMIVRMMSRGIIKRPDMNLSLLPYLQYAFSDRYSFRSGFNYFQFVRYENREENLQLEPSQSVGVGVAVTRDIYLFPHIEFTPKNIRSDRTNVALLANINLF